MFIIGGRRYLKETGPDYMSGTLYRFLNNRKSILRSSTCAPYISHLSNYWYLH